LISNKDIVVYGSDNYVAKTTDAGINWSPLSVFTSGTTTVSDSIKPHAIAMVTSSVIFVGSTTGGMLQTSTGGSTWTDAVSVEASAGRQILCVDMYSSIFGIAGKQTQPFC
jgi:photosystem II stability/assembly factor-like uncharacterized protein